MKNIKTILSVSSLTHHFNTVKIPGHLLEVCIMKRHIIKKENSLTTEDGGYGERLLKKEQNRRKVLYLIKSKRHLLTLA
jgi:hypothetical protein